MSRWMNRGNVLGMAYFGWVFGGEEDGFGRRVIKSAGSEGLRHERETRGCFISVLEGIDAKSRGSLFKE